MFTSFGLSESETQVTAQPQTHPAQLRTKRAQVARACDWCRLGRIKCDAERPCRACKQAGRECKNAGVDEFRGVSAATREVHKLRARVKELEGKLLEPSAGDVQRPAREKAWTGVRLDEVLYGPSSLQYFVHRLGKFTGLDLNGATGVVSNLPPKIDLHRVIQDHLHRPQQDYFLDLFWQGYHVVYPVIDEADFRKHYDGLWEDRAKRRGSPLVDIVLALCIQSYMSSDSTASQKTFETVPGDEYYQRVHCALTRFADKAPSLTAVQCCFFSVVYLIAKGHASSAAVLSGTAVQIAVAIGLHHSDDHLRTRLWSCLRTLDMQLSMKLGRPSVTAHLGMRTMVTDDETIRTLGPSYITPAVNSDVNWLSFRTYHQELVEVAHTAQEQLYEAYEDIFQEMEHSNFYDYPWLRERCAKVLTHHLKTLKEWVDALPDGLKTRRLSGIPFSTDRSALDLSGDEPLWLQRQRVILELDYHNLCIGLLRPFICFQPTPALGTLSSDNHCIACLNHARTTTDIVHQLLSRTDIIKGWYQLVDWQYNAAFVAAGFACGYPVCTPTLSARKTLEASATVFEMLGAGEMATLTRTLDAKADMIIGAFKEGLGLLPTPALSLGTGSETTDATSVGAAMIVGLEPTEVAHDGWSGDPTESLLWGDFIKDLDPGLLDWNR